MQRAVTLFEQGKPEAAILEYKKGISHDPLDSDTWFGLANLYHDLGKDKLALETYSKALSYIEHAPELRVPYAELLIDNKKRVEAVKVLKEGITLDPDASAGMKALLGRAAMSELDDAAVTSPGNEDTASESASGGSSTKSASSKKAAPKRKAKAPARKKLCKRFCPGSLDDLAPKSK